ncbi:MAG: hypothetical protein ACOX22_08320 [Caldicoprobacterales bacterium]
MYIDTYIAIPLWVFAIFGFFCFLVRTYITIDVYKRKKHGVYTLIISVKNQEEAIEGIVRGFIVKAGLDSTEEKLLDIVLLDFDSTDKTPKVLEKLANDYSVVKVIRPEDLPAHIKTL